MKATTRSSWFGGRIAAAAAAASLVWAAPAALGGPAVVDPERAAALILADDADQHAFVDLLQYETSVRHEGAGDPFKYRIRWAVRGDPILGEISVAMIRDGAMNSVTKYRAGDRYHVNRSTAQDVQWKAWTDRAPDKTFRTPGFDPVQYFTAPAFGVRVRDILTSRPVIEASSDGDVLDVTCAQGNTILKWLDAGQPVAGSPALRLRFERIHERYRLTRLDVLETVEVVAPGSDSKKVIWERNKRVMGGFGECEVFGRLRCGVAVRTEFADFVRVAGTVVPARMSIRDQGGTTHAWMDRDTIRVGDAGGESPFDFRPPPEFGPRGMLFDFVNGREECVGFTVTPEDALSKLVERGREARGDAQIPQAAAAVDPLWTSAGAGAAAAALGLAAFTIVRRRRRRALPAEGLPG